MRTASEPWPQHRREATLKALRHLPSAAVVSEPEDPEAAPLLQGLMDLPDEADPSAWLIAEHRRLTARVALRAELEYLFATATGMSRARRAGARPDDVRDEPLDRFSSDVERAGGLHHDLAREAGLAAALAAVRSDMDVARDAMAWATSQHPLLADLLAAMDLPDPVGWVAEHRAHLAAEVVLGEIAGQVARNFSFNVGDVWRVIHPMLSVTVRDLRVTLRRVDFGTTGTLLVVDVTKPIPVTHRAALRGGASHRIVTDLLWRGFEEMRDNCGHYYLMARYEEGRSRDSHGLRTDSARQSCFPELACSGPVTLSSAGYRLDTLDLSGDPSKNHITMVSAPLNLEFSADVEQP